MPHFGTFCYWAWPRNNQHVTLRPNKKVIKNGVTIFLLLLITCQVFSPYLVTATFYANRTYIAENLCVNRSKPAMHCEGKCQLDKKLKETNRDQKSNTERKAGLEMMVYIFQPAPPLNRPQSLDICPPQNGVPNRFSLQYYHPKALHPPKMA